jgi:tetratricopeptide (TPR) repeat protein
VEAGSLIAERFQLQQRVGQGGMGVVYRATDRWDGQPVALKLLDVDRAAERFGREARVLAGLQHPAIVRYVAHGQASSGELYLAMEWLEGETLGDRLARGPLEVPHAVALASRVADALACAHARGVVHRDIKPDNLFLPARDGLVKVLDFGIARDLLATRVATRTGVVIGTLGYMAPEQARGDRTIDGRADVFALGCVLFECLTGARAFAGENAMAVLARILLSDPARVRELRPDVPAELDALVARMLAKDPAARPADGAAVLAALAALGVEPVAAVAPPGTSVVLTDAEQRLVCVVLARATRDPVPPTDVIDPADRTLDAVMDQRLKGLEAVARAFGARIEPLLRDSFLAVITGAGAATDQAALAARCALALCRALPDHVLALATGRAQQSERGPVGEVIDRAARLAAPLPSSTAEGARTTPRAGVRIDALTAGLLGDAFEVLADDGADGRMLLSLRDAAEAPRTLLGRATRCVGREREVARMVAAFDQCVEEPGARAVLVSAPPGVGKSRLRIEATRAIRERCPEAHVALGRCDPMRAGAPLALLSSMIARAVGLHDGDAAAERGTRLRERLSLTLGGESLEHAVSFLGELLGSPSEAPPSEALRIARQQPAVMGEQIREAWVAWLRAQCETGPVVLVLEDLHWGDAPTVKTVDYALRELSALPLLVLAFARPEVDELFPRLWQDRALERFSLKELGRKASEALVRLALGAAVDPAAVEQLTARAGGNAFFLEELIRAHADGRGELLPQTVLAMAQARFERLPDDARRALRAASAYGEVFWRGAVEALLGTRAGLEGDWPAALVDAELLVRRPESRFRGEAEYAFRHALVRDAAYASLTDADLARAHRGAALWLQAHGEPEPWVLAEHFERGRDEARAAEAYHQAAAQALARNDFQVAIDRADRALGLGAAGDLVRDLLLVRARALVAATRFMDARPALEAVLALTSEDDLALRAELYTHLAGVCTYIPGIEVAREYGRRAVEHAERTGRADLLGAALANHAMAIAAMGDVAEALRIVPRAEELGGGLSPAVMSGYAHMGYLLGRYDEGLAAARRYGEVLRSVNDVAMLLFVRGAEAMIRTARGEYGVGLRMLADVVALGTRHRVGVQTARALTMTGGVYIDLGDLARAEEMERRAVEQATAAAYPPSVVSANIDLVSLYLRQGQLARCEALMPEVARAVAAAAGMHGWIWSLRYAALRAELSLARGAAADALTAATELTTQQWREKYLQLGLVLRGRARMALGAQAEALADLRDAVAVARRMGAPLLLVNASAVLLAHADDPAVRAEARDAVARIAGSLDDDALRVCFLAQPSVRAVMDAAG